LEVFCGIVGLAAAGICTASHNDVPRRTCHDPSRSFGPALYAARGFSADLQGSLDRLAEIGLRNVEAFDFVSRPAEIRAALDAAGLAAPTGHARS
jgi:hypothetical protein